MEAPMRQTRSILFRQRGSALIISLVFLLVLTLIGTSALRNSIMQEQMSGNSRDWNVAFQAAEAALREAETYLLETPVLPDFDNADGLYQLGAANRPDWAAIDPSDGAGYFTYGEDLYGTAARPKYFIERLTTVTPTGLETETGTPLGEVSYFRVTAVGYGGAVDGDENPVASIVLSTVYRSR
jgi:type IV pilus assembly protein PilX